jgi:hypothetical protein
VESSVSVDGNHFTWLAVTVCRKDWEPDFCSRKPLRSVQRWISSKISIERRNEWRIEEGDWHVDILVEANIPYKPVDLIVLAIRHKELINKLSTSVGPIKLNTEIPNVDPMEILKISKIDSPDEQYEVLTHDRGEAGSGLTLRVKIVEGKVELHSWSQWMA